MGLANFRASQGWLGRWKRRFNVLFKTYKGESADADVPASDTWKMTVLPQLLTDYAPQDRYNADETAIFFKALQRGSHVLSGHQAHGGKEQKARITCLFIVNEDGSDRTFFVVGRSEKPRGFSGHVPTSYFANKKAWMTRTIWSTIIHQLDGRMRRDGRNIVLVIDNASCHFIDPPLTNINIVSLPPNTTALAQPLDQGIIKCIKARYRRQFHRKK